MPNPGNSPLAHSRIEHLDSAGLPAISIVLSGGRELAVWSEFRDTHALAIGSQKPKGRAIGLFLDFIQARGDLYREVQQRHRLFKSFADALVLGTIQGGEDPSGLWWLPGSQNIARRAVAAVTEIGDWIEVEYGKPALNPTRTATFAEQILFWRAWRLRTDASLLKHIRSTARALPAAKLGRDVLVRGHRPAVPNGSTKSFPEAMFCTLLQTGFRRSESLRWTTYRDQAITLLLHDGGLRVSEPMHMWLDDVYIHPEDGTAAVVRVYHPTDGLREYRDPTTGRSRMITRAEYLLLRYDRRALTDLAGKKHVGWKDPLLSDQNEKYMHVFWRSAAASRAFLIFCEAYIRLRPRVTKHPYLFITDQGNPMTPIAYQRVHAAAMRRIGLIPARTLGTTPHGHRHAYGKYLRKADMTSKAIQTAMHHKSETSHNVYTEADSAEVIEAMLKAEKCITDKYAYEWVNDAGTVLAD